MKMNRKSAFLRQRAMCATLLTAVMVCLPAWNAVPQNAATAANASRLPKGIPGLVDGQAKSPSPNWLLDAKDDQERFRRLQIYAGGTYEQMWQIGYRYQQTYQAIADRNWELSLYHWRKLRDVFNVALMKRPNRTPNAEAIFLDEAWKELEKALASKNSQEAESIFLAERDACMACHAIEKMDFLNDTPIFRNTASFPAAKK